MPTNEAKKKYDIQYAKNKLKRIPLNVQKEKYEEIKAAADNAGEPVNGYIKKAIDERMERDSQALSSTAAASATVQQPSQSKPAKRTTAAQPDPKQQSSQGKPAAPKTAAPGKTSLNPARPFTKQDAEKIDTEKLLHDMRYQFDVATVFGSDALVALLAKARGQEPNQGSSSMENIQDTADTAPVGKGPGTEKIPPANETLEAKLDRLRMEHPPLEKANAAE